MPLTIIAAAACLILLAGCATGIDSAKVSESIRAATGESVILQCPEDIPLETGLVTICAATVDGTNARVAITQVDDQGNVDWTIGRTLNVDGLPSVVEAEIGVPVEVQCPLDIPLEEGLVVDCMVTDGEYEGILVVTQLDNLGNIDWSWRGVQDD